MRSFKDALGRTWTISIDIVVRDEIKSLLDIDVFGAIDGSLEQKISDPSVFAKLLYQLCKEQAEKNSIPEPQFCRGIQGDAFQEAWDALYGAIADFSPPRQRLLLLKVMTRVKEEADGMVAKAMAKLDEPLQDQETLSERSTGSPVSPVLTPAA
jgi:hypothetical protein